MPVLQKVSAVCGAILGVVSTLLGGFDVALILLFLLMVTDYVSGVVVALKNKSRKTGSGGLSSSVGFKGIVKKCIILLFVMIAVLADKAIGVSFIRNYVVLSYCCNELLSICENVGLTGIKLPDGLEKALDLLNRKDD